MLREITIHGARAETFHLNVDSVAEAVRAIIALRPAMRAWFHDHDWRVVLGDVDGGYVLDATELTARAGRQAIHFTPELVVGKRGGIGKIIIGAVLIAAAVLIPGSAFAAGGALAFLGSVGITQTAIMGFGISMLVGGTAMLLSPTPKGPKATDSANPEERPSFFFNGATNLSEQGAPVPLAYGYFRCGSIVINAGVWNEDIAPEEVAAAASPKLVAGSWGTDMLLPRIEDSGTPRALVVAKGGGKGGTPGASYAPREAPNTLRSRSMVRLHEILSEGTIYGPPNASLWGQYIFLDDTPLMGSDGSFNFKITAAYLRAGVPQETPIPGFPASENTISVGAQVKYGFPITRQVASPDTTSIRLQLRVPQLMYQHPNGDLIETGVDVQIDYQVDGQPWTRVTQDRIIGKTTTGYERTYGFWLPARDGRDIALRVTRLSIDSENVTPGKAYNETYWTSFVEVVDGIMRHDDTAAAAFVLDAEQFPSIPKRAYEFYWLIVRVPSNYDPWARTYSGDWDGSFQWAWTNNPAWVLYDLFVDERRGLGRDIPYTSVDKWSFYQAAVYNDGWVPNGFGGWEPRFTFNGILNTTEEAANVLQAVASSFRAQFYVAGGVVMLAQDRPAVGMARVFGRANVEGDFDYQSTEVRSRITTVNVAWNDPTQTWSQQIEPVVYPEMLGRYGYRETQIAAMGCTSRGQSIRAGRYFLWGAHWEQETVSFVVGLENCDMRPGDVIGVQDPSRAAVAWSGRVVTRAGNTITLDRAVPGAPGGTLLLAPAWIPGQDTPVISATITQWVSSSQVIVSADAGALDRIGPDSMWAITGSVAIRQFRVVSVAEQEGLKFQITAAIHDPRKYTFVEEGITLPAPAYTALPSGPLLPPTAPNAVDFYWLDPTGEPQAGLTFSWTPSTDPRVIHYVADAVGPGYVGQHWSTVPSTTVNLDIAATGEWTFSVAGVDAIGRKSAPVWLTVNTATLARVPLPPLFFFAGQAASGTAAYLQWVLPDDLSISYWWLKWTPDIDHPNWDAAITVQAMIPRRLLSIVVPAQSGIFMMKSVSVRGVESATAAMAKIIVSDVRPFGAHRIEQPTWNGTKTNCTVDAAVGELVLYGPDTATAKQALLLRKAWGPPAGLWPSRPVATAAEAIAAAEYVTPELTLTQRAEVMSKVLLFGRGVIAADYMVNWVPLASAKPLTRTTSAAWDTVLEERYRLADSSWSPYQPAGVAALETNGVQFRLRMAVFEPATDVRMGRMEEWLMLLPYKQVGSGTTNASGNLVVTFNPAYYQPPTVYAWPTSGNVMVVVVGVTKTQCTITSYTPGGAVAANVPVSYEVNGYGRAP